MKRILRWPISIVSSLFTQIGRNLKKIKNKNVFERLHRNMHFGHNETWNGSKEERGSRAGQIYKKLRRGEKVVTYNNEGDSRPTNPCVTQTIFWEGVFVTNFFLIVVVVVFSVCLFFGRSPMLLYTGCDCVCVCEPLTQFYCFLCNAYRVSDAPRHTKNLNDIFFFI